MLTRHRPRARRLVARLAWLPAALVLRMVAGCAPPPAPATAPPTTPPSVSELAETPVPDGPWRPHRLARCAAEDRDVPSRVERYLGLSSEFFRDGSGSDGMIELEMALDAGLRHPLLLVTLGQLYLMAGQGEPSLLPTEGPAADVGDWTRNRRRLLARAQTLLEEAAATRPDDAAVDYLLADVARARGDQAAAASLAARGMAKCTGGRSFALLQLYQVLNRYPARYLGGPTPEYPAASLAAGRQGDVELDVLLDPTGAVRQVVVVASPAADLTAAAAASLRAGAFEAARVGKYPIWAWLRVTTAFHLSDG